MGKRGKKQHAAPDTSASAAHAGVAKQKNDKAENRAATVKTASPSAVNQPVSTDVPQNIMHAISPMDDAAISDTKGSLDAYRPDKHAPPELKESRSIRRFTEADLAPTQNAEEIAGGDRDTETLEHILFAAPAGLEDDTVTQGPFGHDSFVMRDSDNAAYAPLVPKNDTSPVVAEAAQPVHEKKLVMTAKALSPQKPYTEEEVEVDFTAHLAPDAEAQPASVPIIPVSETAVGDYEKVSSSYPPTEDDENPLSTFIPTQSERNTCSEIDTSHKIDHDFTTSSVSQSPSSKSAWLTEEAGRSNLVNSQAGPNTKPESQAAIPSYIKFAPLRVDCMEAPTLSSRLYGVFSLAPVFVLSILYLISVFPIVEHARLLWLGTEARTGALFQSAMDGHIAMPLLNGEAYAAMPLYTWFLTGLREVLLLLPVPMSMWGEPSTRIVFLGSAISGLFLLWSVLIVAKFMAWVDRRGMFAAGCVLLSTASFWGMAHLAGQHLLFATFVLLALCLLYRGLLMPIARRSMSMGFVCTALAMLAGGLPGFLIPIGSCLVFSLWSGRFLRCFRKDFCLGAVFSILPCLIWLGFLWSEGQAEFVTSLFMAQVPIFLQGVDAGPTWWEQLALLFAGSIPWILLLFVIPWYKVFSIRVRSAIRTSFRGDHQGLAFIWLAVFVTCACGFIFKSLNTDYIAPLIALLSIITGRVVLQLSPLSNSILQKIFAVFCLLGITLLILVPLYISGNNSAFIDWFDYLHVPHWNIEIAGCLLVAAMLLVVFCLFIGTLKARRPESTLLVVVMLATLCSYAVTRWSMPSMDTVMSPKAGAEMVESFVQKGFEPVAYRMSHGALSSYTSTLILETELQSTLEGMVRDKKNMLVILSEHEWKAWYLAPAMKEGGRFWLGGTQYLVMLHEPEVVNPNRDHVKTLLKESSPFLQHESPLPPLESSDKEQGDAASVSVHGDTNEDTAVSAPTDSSLAITPGEAVETDSRMDRVPKISDQAPVSEQVLPPHTPAPRNSTIEPNVSGDIPTDGTSH